MSRSPDGSAPRSVCTMPERSAGFSMLELMVAMGVFAMVLLLIMAAVVVTEEVRRFAEEKDVAREAMENELARLQGLGFQGVLDELAAIGAGSTVVFPVPGLDRDSIPSGQVDVLLNETVTDADIGVGLGMPRDLDGDGLANNVNTAATATLLPLVASVTWTGIAGRQTVRTVLVMHRPRLND